jgi:hypothetical protein
VGDGNVQYLHHSVTTSNVYGAIGL